MPSQKLCFIVEDNQNDRETLEGYLKEFGLETMSFDNSEDALENLNNHTPSLIILDYEMNNINATDFMVKVSERLLHGQWQAHFISSHEFSAEEKVSLPTLGITHMFKKPIDKEKFKAAVKELEI